MILIKKVLKRRQPLLDCATQCVTRHHATITRSFVSIKDDVTNIVIALSGGVDSSVAAALLKQQFSDTKCNLHTIHMSNWNATSHDDDALKSCSSEADWHDAECVAQHLALPIRRVSFEAEYWNQVFEPFVQSLAHFGIMGNPDIECNVYVKFGALHNYLQNLYHHQPYILATGHYARLWYRDQQPEPPDDVLFELEKDHKDTKLLDWLLSWGQDNNYTNDSTLLPLLLAARDRSKDQSYFLTGCHSRMFQNVVFPLGEYHKQQVPDSINYNNLQTFATKNAPLTVREMAKLLQLPTASKRESMGLCFVGKRSTGFASFIQDYWPTDTVTPERPISFVDVDTGQTLEGHGIQSSNPMPLHACLYAIGQKVKLGGQLQKYFCVRHDLEKNIVYVCAGAGHPQLYSNTLTVAKMHWMVGVPPRPLLNHGKMRAQCRIRHLESCADCTVETVAADDTSQKVNIVFDYPVRGVAKGQVAAIYVGNGSVCLGSGQIS